MMYHLRNDVACPKCKCTSFGIEEHTEQRPDQDKTKDDSYLVWLEIYCHDCDKTLMRIDK
jgi:phage FluMu protein Com